MYHDLNTAGANIASNDSDIANLQNDVATLQAGGGGGSAGTYTKATLPLNGSSADLDLLRMARWAPIQWHIFTRVNGSVH